MTGTPRHPWASQSYSAFLSLVMSMALNLISLDLK